jgi:hypothetical protein
LNWDITSSDFDLEMLILEVVKSKYQMVNPKAFDLYASGKEPFSPIYAEDVAYPETIYGSPSKMRMCVYHPNLFPKCLAIDTIWQKSSGSVDSKFPYLVANIKEKYPYPTIIVIDGGGYRKGARTWLQNQVDEKLLHVFSVEEFKEWVEQENL